MENEYEYVYFAQKVNTYVEILAGRVFSSPFFYFYKRSFCVKLNINKFNKMGQISILLSINPAIPCQNGKTVALLNCWSHWKKCAAKDKQPVVIMKRLCVRLLLLSLHKIPNQIHHNLCACTDIVNSGRHNTHERRQQNIHSYIDKSRTQRMSLLPSFSTKPFSQKIHSVFFTFLIFFTRSFRYFACHILFVLVLICNRKSRVFDLSFFSLPFKWYSFSSFIFLFVSRRTNSYWLRVCVFFISVWCLF